MSSPTKSEGGIYFRKDRKKWEVRFLEFDPLTSTNKTKTKSFKTKDEAKKYLKTIMYFSASSLVLKFLLLTIVLSVVISYSLYLTHQVFLSFLNVI